MATGVAKFTLIATGAFLISTLLAIVLGLSTTTSAAPVVGFNAGKIIDDAVFTNANAMNASSIQSFLNSKVPVCDTWGTSPSEFGGGTRAQWGTARGTPPPYTCLKDYTEGGKTSAQIIADTAVQFQINPQVLIVVLQKEQGLVTDTWPLSSQYRTAMGYGCPDTAACDSQYYGLTNQIQWAARMYRAIMNDSPTWYTPYELGNNFIRFSPDVNCGGSTVYIQNRATQALYNYTPYQPNQATLNAGWGTAPCGAYGNRNFYLYFTSWFDPFTTVFNNVNVNTISQPDTTPVVGQEVTYTFSFTNNLSSSVTFDQVGVVGRLGSVTAGANRDFGWQGSTTIAAGATQQFSFTTRIRDIGTIYAWPALLYQGRYLQYNNWGTAMVARKANISLSSPLTLSPNNPVPGQSVTLSSTIRNNEDQPIQIEAVGIPIRFYGVYNYDVAWTGPITIAAGGSQSISGSIIFDKPGPYTAWTSVKIGDTYSSVSNVEQRNLTTPTPSFILTYTQLPNTTPAVGEDISIGFKLRNNLPVPITINSIGTAGRYSNGANGDFGWTGPQTFSANEEKTYTMTTTIGNLGAFRTWVALLHNGSYVQYSNYGVTMQARAPNLTMSSALSINSGNSFLIGQPVVVRTTIQNNEPRPIKYSAIGIPIRFYGVYSYDTGWLGSGSLSALGQAGDSVALTGTVNFDKAGPYTIWASVNQGGTYRTIGNPLNINL